jgi:hypothetical protein
MWWPRSANNCAASAWTTCLRAPSRPEPRNQHVLVFRIGSEAGAVINAVRNGTRRLGSAPGRLLDQAVKELQRVGGRVS